MKFLITYRWQMEGSYDPLRTSQSIVEAADQVTAQGLLLQSLKAAGKVGLLDKVRPVEGTLVT